MSERFVIHGKVLVNCAECLPCRVALFLGTSVCYSDPHFSPTARRNRALKQAMIRSRTLETSHAQGCAAVVFGPLTGVPLLCVCSPPGGCRLRTGGVFPDDRRSADLRSGSSSLRRSAAPADGAAADDAPAADAAARGAAGSASATVATARSRRACHNIDSRRQRRDNRSGPGATANAASGPGSHTVPGAIGGRGSSAARPDAGLGRHSQAIAGSGSDQLPGGHPARW